MTKITSELIWKGEKYILEYCDADNFENLPYQNCKQVYGVCFVGDNIVLVYGESGEDGKGWGLVGGHVEKNETFEQTLTREVEEETNMSVEECQPIGVQKVISPTGEVSYQLRFVAKVKPLGEFVSDPGGSVTEIKIIDPNDYRKYFDWGEIGERIINRAIEIKNQSVTELVKNNKKLKCE